jgi:UDP-glucose 6-dehydrogenase
MNVTGGAGGCVIRMSAKPNAESLRENHMRGLIHTLLLQSVEAVKQFGARVGKFNAALGLSEIRRLTGFLPQGAI